MTETQEEGVTLWNRLPNELKYIVVEKLDIVSRIKMARCSLSTLLVVDDSKKLFRIVRLDLMIKNGVTRWLIEEQGGNIIRVDYTQVAEGCIINTLGGKNTILVNNPSHLDQALTDLVEVVKGPDVEIEQFRLYMTADDDNYTAERANEYFEAMVDKFGALSHTLKIGKINIDYSSFTVFETDMQRGLQLLNPQSIVGIIIKGAEGTILNARNVMDCDVWTKSKQLICIPAIRPIEAFWNKNKVSTGLVVERFDFLPTLIEIIRKNPDFEQMSITMSYFGEELTEEETLADILLVPCPPSDHILENEHPFMRTYTTVQKGLHLQMEVTDSHIKLFTVPSKKEEEDEQEDKKDTTLVKENPDEKDSANDNPVEKI